jgi:hypothetical protein
MKLNYKFLEGTTLRKCAGAGSGVPAQGARDGARASRD